MMRFESVDGEVFQGQSYENVVQEMASGKMPAPRSLTSYRKSVAKRLARLLGVKVDPETNETLIKTMIDADLLRKL